MNEKEVSEIRRRYRLEKSAITHVRGCYVSEQNVIVSEFDQALSLMTQEESEKFLTILKRTLSGSLGKNLMDLSFTTQQVVHSEEHRLLMTLRDSELKDEGAVQAFFQRVIQSVTLEEGYLILLAHDKYDIPYRSKDDGLQADASSDVYSYILCSICPIKQTKPALSYYIRENEFRNQALDFLVSSPQIGFLFPAFDDRSANLYSALYYSKDIENIHDGFIQTIFGQEAPMPPAVQKETFQSILCSTLDEDCNLDVVQSVHDQMCNLVIEHKENKEREPLKISKVTVRRVLEHCGVSSEHVAAFDEKFDHEFGYEAQISPKNIVNTSQIEVSMPDVTIRVKPERSDLVETRVIGGARYILIRAEEGVELNGVPIHIGE